MGVNSFSSVPKNSDASDTPVVEAMPLNENRMQMNQAVPEIQHFNEDGNVQTEVAHSNYDCNSDSDSDVQSEFNENSDSESLEHAMDELELTSFF